LLTTSTNKNGAKPSQTILTGDVWSDGLQQNKNGALDLGRSDPPRHFAKIVAYLAKIVAYLKTPDLLHNESSSTQLSIIA